MSKLQGSPGKKNIANRSHVWQYILCDKETKVARCTLCNKTMKYTGGTTNLRYHLTSAHQMTEFEVVGPSARVYREGSGGDQKTPSKKRVKTLPTFRVGSGGSALTPTRPASWRNSGSPMSMGSPSSQRMSVCGAERGAFINTQVVQMLAQCLQPVSFAEDEGFVRMLRELEPGYTTPGSMVLQSMLMNRYEEVQEKLKACLNKDAKNFGLVFDVWTGSDRGNFLTVTVHYLTSKWNRESWVLGSDRVSSKPSCHEISLCIRNLLSQYQLSLESVTAVVNRQGMLRAQVGKVGGSLLCDSMSCAAEKLEQCVQAGFQVPRVKEIVEDAAKMVNYFLHNEEAKAILEQTKIKEGKANLDLEEDRKGAWLATADMLIRVVALREVIETVKVLDEKNHLMYLTTEKWDNAQQLETSLQILKAALTVISDTKSGSVSCLLPVVHSILQHCEGREEDGSVLGDFLNVIAKEVREKWDLNSIMPSSVTMLSALLDPRFKQLKFIADEDKLDVIDALKHLVAANASEPQESEEQPANSVSPFLCLFGEDEFNSKPENTDTEVATYLQYPPLSRDMCPLDWWRMNQNKFPELAKIARCYLAVPAIAQLWCDIAAGTSKVDLKRALLEVEIAGPLIFLNKNWSLLS